ncbi:hypothetical protein ACFL5G_05615 [Candidatus Margulisiibacteriota bacterium]
MGACKHRHKKFIAVTDYRGYPEKIYSCQDCGMMITDFASESELNDFKGLSKRSHELTVGMEEKPEKRLSAGNS